MPDVGAENGIIHVIDEVLVPPSLIDVVMMFDTLDDLQDDTPDDDADEPTMAPVLDGGDDNDASMSPMDPTTGDNENGVDDNDSDVDDNDSQP